MNNVLALGTVALVALILGTSGQTTTSGNVTTSTSTASPVILDTSTSTVPESTSPASTYENVTTTTKDPYSEFVGPIRKCPKGNDASLNYCMKLILADLKPRLAAGVPEIDLPPLDPLHIDRSDFHQGFGAIVLKAVFTNLTVHHLSNFTDAEFTINSKARELRFKMIVPEVRIDGTYTLGGNVLFFPIGGTGPYFFEVGDVHVSGLCKLKTEKREKGKVVVVESIAVDIEINKIYVQLLNLFNGNPVLGPVINNVINENGQELFQDIKPTVAKEIGDIMSAIVNAVISNLDFLAGYLE